MRVQFGVGIPQGGRRDLSEISEPVAQYEALTNVARTAESLGFNSVWLLDHFHTLPEPKLEPTFEVFTTLAGLARDTQKIRLGQLAVCNGFRNPALVAKMCSTIDVMSNGRLILGLGAGWHEAEAIAYGYRFPDLKERMARFGEAARIIKLMWTQNEPSFVGAHYSLDRAINEPKGVQRPHIPLWLAGAGESVTLRLVAELGSGCNLANTPPPAVVTRKLSVLREHCDRLRVSFDSLSRSVSVVAYLVDKNSHAQVHAAERWQKESVEEVASRANIWTTAELIRYLDELIELGIDYFVFYLPRMAYSHDQMERIASEILPRYRPS